VSQHNFTAPERIDKASNTEKSSSQNKHLWRGKNKFVYAAGIWIVNSLVIGLWCPVQLTKKSINQTILLVGLNTKWFSLVLYLKTFWMTGYTATGCRPAVPLFLICEEVSKITIPCSFKVTVCQSRIFYNTSIRRCLQKMCCHSFCTKKCVNSTFQLQKSTPWVIWMNSGIPS
jgi:hypothetical protein